MHIRGGSLGQVERWLVVGLPRMLIRQVQAPTGRKQPVHASSLHVSLTGRPQCPQLLSVI